PMVSVPPAGTLVEGSPTLAPVLARNIVLTVMVLADKLRVVTVFPTHTQPSSFAAASAGGVSAHGLGRSSPSRTPISTSASDTTRCSKMVPSGPRQDDAEIAAANRPSLDGAGHPVNGVSIRLEPVLHSPRSEVGRWRAVRSVVRTPS